MCCLVWLAKPAQSDAILTAEELRDACTRPNAVWASFCSGYVQATADFAGMSDLACIPDGTTRAELVERIDALAFDRIAEGEVAADIPAFAVTMSVLQSLYPCDTEGEASE